MRTFPVFFWSPEAMTSQKNVIGWLQSGPGANINYDAVGTTSTPRRFLSRFSMDRREICYTSSSLLISIKGKLLSRKSAAAADVACRSRMICGPAVSTLIGSTVVNLANTTQATSLVMSSLKYFVTEAALSGGVFSAERMLRKYYGNITEIEQAAVCL